METDYVFQPDDWQQERGAARGTTHTRSCVAGRTMTQDVVFVLLVEREYWRFIGGIHKRVDSIGSESYFSSLIQLTLMGNRDDNTIAPDNPQMLWCKYRK